MRVTVVIPAYRPTDSLIELVQALVERGLSITVVDDGSGPAYASVFDRLARYERVHVIRHELNQGKGAALKSAMAYSVRDKHDLIGIITADADGQHRPDDILAVSRRLVREPDSLVLGARAFSGEVPMRSRFGNFLTRGIMRFLLGRHLTDTQTGLRGIPAELIPHLLRIPGARYEFEMEMLLAAMRRGVPVVEERIETVYESGNPTSHFRALRDSARIYFVLLRFAALSVATSRRQRATREYFSSP